MSKQTRRALYVVNGAIVLLAIYQFSKPKPSAEFRQLVDYVAEHGEYGTIPSEGLRNFGLPDGGLKDVPCRAISNPLDYIGHVKAITVRRGEGATYIFLTDTYLDRGTFYRCSEDGKLIRVNSLQRGVVPPPLNDATNQFAAELDYWLKWWAAKQ
jgi:hypothetical protein